MIPKGPSSWASWRVSPIWPALAEAYAWMPVRLTPSPAPLEMFTIRPYPASFMAGATAWAVQNEAFRFTATIPCQSPGDTCSSGRPTWPSTPPALFTRTSTRPES